MVKQTPRVMEFIAGDVKMTLTPATIEAVYREWLAAHPGCTIRDMSSNEFADRCMKKLIEGARRMPTGHA